MPDTAPPETPPEPPVALALPDARPKSRTRRKFVQTLTVRLEDGDRIDVPLDGAANRAANQILVAKLRHILEGQLKKIEDSGRALDTEEIKDLMMAITRLIALTDSAYSGEPAEPSGSDVATSDLGKMASQLVESAARGLASGQDARLKLIEDLGRTKRVDAIEVEAKPVEPQ